MNNRLHNATNPYQGSFKRVLCVCSAGLLRSPTTAWVLSNEPFNFNTRACGIDLGHALVPIDEVLVTWAQEIVVMNMDMVQEILAKYPGFNGHIINLDLPDNFRYRDPELVKLITARYLESCNKDL